MNFFNEYIISFIKNYLSWIIVIIELIVIIIISILLINKKEVTVVDNNEIAYVDTNEVYDTIEYVIFDIKGAIKNPGVYKVEKGTIINDAITLAGGLKNNATTININLGKEVSDRMVIYIPTKNELTKKVSEDLTKVVIVNDNNKVDDNEALIDNDNCIGIEVEEEKEVKKETKENNKTVKEEKENALISINKATKEELTKLPSIGDSKAQKIIDYREENGSFKTIEDIKNVSGIGDALFEKIKDYITI